MQGLLIVQFLLLHTLSLMYLLPLLIVLAFRALIKSSFKDCCSIDRIRELQGPPPPRGNYGVNTGLLTNLVDSQGRIIKGVQSVPIPLPPSGEVRNSKG